MSRPTASIPPPGAPPREAIRISRPHRVRRFGATERALHMVHGSSFLAMLATGFMLGLPCMVKFYGPEHRPLVLDVHLVIAALWGTGIAPVMVFGDRRMLRRTREQFESLDGDDLRWLRSRAARQAPQGRFNGGQKFHAVAQAGLTVLLVVSGVLLWMELRVSGFAVPGALGLHDYAMAGAVALVAGHVGIALSPRIRASLPSMVRGTVPVAYARSHHADWVFTEEPHEQRPPRTPARYAAAVATVAVGAGAAILMISG